MIEQHEDIWQYRDCESATLRSGVCPTCGRGVAPIDLWARMVDFAVSEGANLRAAFAEKEKGASAEVRSYINRHSSYRVQKSLLIRCAERGISPVDANGKPKAKNILELELSFNVVAELHGIVPRNKPVPRKPVHLNNAALP